MTTEVFPRVSYQVDPPRSSWSARRQRAYGRLVVGDARAELIPARGEPVVIERVLRVTKGSNPSFHGSIVLPAVDTNIEVLYGDRARPHTIYLNDARWPFLATYLPQRKLL